MKNINIAPFEVILVIVKKGKAEEAVEILTNNYANFSLITLAEGTTDQATAEFFGFGIQEREMVMGLIDPKESEKTLEILKDYFELDEPFNGLAITIPIKSATNIVVDMIKNKLKGEKNGEENREENGEK